MSDSFCTIHNIHFEDLQQECGLCFDEQKKELERLRDLNETFKHDAKNQRDIVEQQQKRIENLEDARFALLDQVSALSGEEDFHIITTEQIRAAWKAATRPITEESRRVGWIAREAMLNILRFFGVVRCEGCGGRARGWIDNDPNADGSYEAVCQDCNGEGWVMKDE